MFEHPPASPHQYTEDGFRIVPIASDGSKAPLVPAGTFGKDKPDATVHPSQFRSTDGVAILCGPTPRWADDGSWLAVIDIDGDWSLERLQEYVGEPLPATLTSKGQRHLYYKVPPSEARACLRQWAPLFGRGEGAPKVDLKWSGGYAIEPHGAWDGEGYDPARIATLPTTWIRRVLELRNARPATAPARTAGVSEGSIDLDAAPAAVVAALASVWPAPGEGCHDAALALGGILGESHWTADAVAVFAAALFEAAGVSDRTNDVLYSLDTRRAGGEAKGWPSLRVLLAEGERGKAAGSAGVDAALAALRAGVPGLRAPRVQLPELDSQGRRAVTEQRAALTLQIGSDDEIARKVIEGHCTDARGDSSAVFDEGQIWRYDREHGVWSAIEDHVSSRWIEAYDGVVYDTTDRGKPIWVKLGHGRVTSIRRRIEAKLASPGFFGSAPRGLAFENGWLDLEPSKTRGVRCFGPLEQQHRARWVLPCAYEPDAARRARPAAWVRYLRSIWGNDSQSIELVHQLLGYLLSGRCDLQKIFVLLGPPRAGKGTLLHLIQLLFRDQAGPFKVSALDQTFGMQSMLGKAVVYDPDVRRSGSMFKSEGAMVERLLSLSAHDVQAVPRKNLPDVLAALPCRLLLAANPPFGLSDVGGALASRFVILTFPKSFLGAEQADLAEQLAQELPAIVALALDGLDRLNAVGRFIEPDSSSEERASVERAQNPLISFLEECCEIGDYSIECGKLFAAVQAWREANGHKRMSNQAFSEFLRQRKINKVRIGSGYPGKAPRIQVYQGIRLIEHASGTAGATSGTRTAN
jgi:P4 family phage/plasmid primase-like protien